MIYENIFLVTEKNSECGVIRYRKYSSLYFPPMMYIGLYFFFSIIYELCK